MIIKIDPEFEKHCPKLRPEEAELLESSLRAHGLLQPLSVWDHKGCHIILDGHNRYRLCQKLAIEITTRPIEGINKRSAWTRELDPEERARFAKSRPQVPKLKPNKNSAPRVQAEGQPASIEPEFNQSSNQPGQPKAKPGARKKTGKPGKPLTPRFASLAFGPNANPFR